MSALHCSPVNKMIEKNRILDKSTGPTVRNSNATHFFTNRSTSHELSFSFFWNPDSFILNKFNTNPSSKSQQNIHFVTNLLWRLNNEILA